MTRNLSFAKSLLAAKNIIEKKEPKPFSNLQIPGRSTQDEINDEIMLEVESKVKNTFTEE